MKINRINEFENVEVFINYFKDRIEKKYATSFEESTNYQKYAVLCEMLKDYIASDWKKTNEQIYKKKLKQVYYFSMEFLMGRMITNNLMNAGVRNIVEEAFNTLNININEIEEKEPDAGLGNGGLGRLAACFLDSAASINLPVHGNCLRYQKGFFTQEIIDGYQVERPDNWLNNQYAWEVRKEDESIFIPFYGKVNEDNTIVNQEIIKAVPYDVPIIGYKNNVVNTLRMWKAEVDSYPLNVSAHEYANQIDEITSVLYPADDTIEGKYLRLKQQYLFSAAGVLNAIRKHKKQFNTMENFAQYNVFQINDTHPTLIIPELMRYLLDIENYSFEKAWDITVNTCAYTNHTIMAEALEKWDIEIFKTLLPRMYQIIELIDNHFKRQLEQKYNDNYEIINSMKIIDDKVIKMAHLAIVGSFSVNGVAQLHTDILKEVEMKNFNEFFIGKFNNKTNGITHRRWCLYSNPELVNLLNNTISPDWVKNPNLLEDLIQYKDDKNVLLKIKEMKLARKKALAKKILINQKIDINPNSIFDIQVKRLHEYKRQLMNALHIMYIYNRLKTDLAFRQSYYPHTFIFGAKSAPTYYFAKKIIKLINTIADKVNNDNDVNNYIKVVFVENYNVTYAESIMPACDVSEQISTASKEASGTGNMKFMMNGAITLGTLDGANVEINQLVGKDSIVLFGLTANEVNNLYKTKDYNPKKIYDTDYRVKEVIDQLTNGFFDNVDKNEFLEISNRLLNQDEYFVLKDFDSYINAHEIVNNLYKNENQWLQISLINIAKSGFFSTDRTMEEYNNDIWRLKKIQ